MEALDTAGIASISSSALLYLYEIHKTDGWLLYNRLSKVLEEKIKEYCGEA